MGDIVDDRAWLAKVLDDDGVVVGAAFAVDGGHLLTCAHVTYDAGADGPGDEVTVELFASGERLSAKVIADGYAKRDGTAGDMALLALDHPPGGLVAAPLRVRKVLRGLGFSAYGFPGGHDDGIWSDGSLGRAAGHEWLQLQVESGQLVAPGCSGGAVWDETSRRVVAMLTSRDLGTKGAVAFAIPLSAVAARSRVVREALPTALELDPAADAHWRTRARGGGAGRDRRDVFSGRSAALGELAAFARERAPGMRVVTGPAGTGKSAVLARLVALLDRRERERLTVAGGREPSRGGVEVDVTFHALGRTAAEFAAHVADVCGVDLDGAGLPPSRFEDGRPLLAVIDAVDEAADAETLCGLLVRMATAGACLLIGCRPHLVSRLTDPDPLQLDQAPYLAREDVEQYASRVIEAESGQPESDATARDIADAADGNFLVAQLLAHAVASRGDAVLSHGVRSAFEALLDALPDPRTARELLLPLALSFGDGLPEELWLASATALSRPVHAADLRTMLDSPAAGFLVARRVDADTRYRLSHEALRATLLGDVADPATHLCVWHALHALVPARADGSRDWASARAYLREHAAEHAAAASRLAELAADVGYAVHGDLPRLRARLAADPATADTPMARLLDLAAGRAQPFAADRRAPLLALAARHAGLEPLAREFDAVSRDGWRSRWAHSFGPPHRLIELGGSDSQATALALARADGRALAATASDDGSVRVFDATTGEMLRPPLAAHAGYIEAVTVGTLNGRAVVVSGGVDAAVRVWDVAANTSHTLQGHRSPVTAVALGNVGGRTMLATGDTTGELRLWDLAQRRPGSRPISAHASAVVSLAFGRASGRDVLASACRRKVGLRDARDGTLIVDELTNGTPGGDGVVLAFDRHGNRDLLACASPQRLVIVDFASNMEVECMASSNLLAVAFVRRRDRSLLLGIDDKATVTVWDPNTGAHGGQVSVAVSRTIYLAAFTEDHLASVAPFGASFRLWNLTQIVQDTHEARPQTPSGVESLQYGHGGERSMLFAAVERRSALAGGTNGGYRLWDAATGAPAAGDSVEIEASWQGGGRGAGDDHREMFTGYSRDPALARGIGYADILNLRRAQHSMVLPGRDPAGAAILARVGGRDVVVTVDKSGYFVSFWDFARRAPLVHRPLLPGQSWADMHLRAEPKALAYANVDGRSLLAVADAGGRVWLCDAQTGQKLGDAVHSGGSVEQLMFGRAGQPFLLVAVYAGGQRVRWWEVTSELAFGHSSSILGSWYGAAFVTSDGEALLALRDALGVHLWRPDGGRPSLAFAEDFGRQMAFTRVGGRELLALSRGATVRIWQLGADAQHVAVVDLLEQAGALTFGADGELFAATGPAVAAFELHHSQEGEPKRVPLGGLLRRWLGRA